MTTCKECKYFDSSSDGKSGICLDDEVYIDSQGEYVCRYRDGAIPYKMPYRGDRD